MHALRPTLVSEEEFLRLPASGPRVELLDGEVIVPPAPTWRHQAVLGNLVFELRTWARTQPRGTVTVGQSPVDIRFGPGRILQPDAFVVLGEVPLDVQGPLDRIPELCVEVLSTDRVMDRVTKRLVYAAAGVREYWVVETTGVVERWHGDALSEVEEIGERLTSPLLPGLSMDVRALASP